MAQYWKKYNLTQVNVLPKNQMGNILLTSESSSVCKSGHAFKPIFPENSANGKVHSGQLLFELSQRLV
jgi:hypothetical protein